MEIVVLTMSGLTAPWLITSHLSTDSIKPHFSIAIVRVGVASKGAAGSRAPMVLAIY
jgi:hypothetical protein